MPADLPGERDVSRPAASQGEAEARTPPGHSAMRVFDRVVDELSADECLRFDVRLERQIARLQAQQLAVRARFVEHRPRLEGESEDRPFSEFAGEELAAELGVAPALGTRRLTLAVEVCTRLPASLRALHEGEIDLLRVESLARQTAALNAVQAGAVERAALEQGGRASHATFRAAVRRRVLKVDPQGANRRHRHAVRGRCVRITDGEDGMGTLRALLSAERMVAVYHRVDVFARLSGTDPEDKRTLDERRADVLYELLMGQDRHSIRPEVQVVVPISTLMGLSDEPGELAGYGPIPADLARELAADSQSTWRRMLTDPRNGQVVEVGDRRFPSPGLARAVRARNRQCIFPGCGKPAINCEIDHTKPHGEGGRTEEENLGPACARHHHLKHAESRRRRRTRRRHAGGAGPGRPPAEPTVRGRTQPPAADWKCEQPTPGVFLWTSPEGRTYRVLPEPYLDVPPPAGPATPGAA
ncbi:MULTISPECIES: HNH endonuclease signature motif containing protein [Frankia]|uniref:HNH nuclease domain-containing protein n=1 Tax=Frankia alni (strain DSM 45986 / CECT 9034 / ACN14a) TaxID=326424 RepID=Q0RH61_FRAAA|nr:MULTISPECIES: HNH endonuclease signature motif containing protein [Frankia]CAJ63172.1 hypothetical protein; putative HNH endonuclease domain [Frankia alni ACN14a]